ncbi:MAG: TonB-dependent receptor [Bacteroidota bacterium]
MRKTVLHYFLTGLLLGTWVGIPLSAFSQGEVRTLSGTVTEGETGEVLPGATILVKGTNVGTLADENGAFSFTTPENAEVLVISYLGYQTQEITIGSSTNFTIGMRSDPLQLGDVVVIGYGQQRKQELTTAVATIDAEDIRDQPVNSFDQALVGKLAGVQVLQTSGSPGAGVSIRVRGVGSITAGNDPLYVIDGVPVSNDNNRATGDVNTGTGLYTNQPINVLSTLNPSVIESIQVLKDASASAIYGSRGSNGVVLITTKKGSVGKPTISYSGYYGLQETTTRYDMLNAYEWAQLNFEGRNNTYKDRFPDGQDTDTNAEREANLPGVSAALIPPEVQPYLDGVQGLTDTDWQDEIFRTAQIQSHALSISGGTKNFRYYASGEYMDQEGLIISSGFKRYSGRFNMDLTAGKLKVGLNINPTLTQHDLVNSEGPWWDHGVVGVALHISPIWPVFNEDESYNFGANAWGFAMTDAVNPVALANEIQDDLDHLRLLGNVYAEYSILDNLSYRLSLGADLNNFQRDYYWPSIVERRGLSGPRVPIGTSRSRFTTNWLVENTLNYTEAIDKHNIQALAGFSAQKETFKNSELFATNFPNDLVSTLNAGQITDGGSFQEEWSLLSVLGRVQYNYDNKYYLSAAIRADGSSRFGENNKWGYFPSASAGWRISGEPFLADNTTISNLKLRASYGQTGNFQIPNYGSIGLLGFTDYVLGGNQLATGLAPSTPSNPNLSWEKTTMIDIGIDFGLFKDAVYLELDYYTADTEDLLLNVPVPMSSGFTTELRNIGEVNNEGFEATVTVQNKAGELGWSVTGNFATNQNEVISLADNVPQILAGGGTGSAQWITTPGEPIGSYYNPVYDGVFMNQEEVDALPSVGNARPGDLKFLDLDGDGEINFANDREIQGNYMPEFTYGASVNLDYKGFDFAASLQGAYGHEILHLFRRYIYNQEGNMNLMRGALNRWISEAQPGDGQTNRANRLQTGSNGQTSNWHLEDGTYMRVRNISLGYTFPTRMMQPLSVSNLRVYFSVQNPFIFTDYLGYNPEVNSRPDSALNPGEDYASYPVARVYTLGLNLSF